MSNKPGSSNYERGDTGGSHGDYEHGVSEAWIRKRVSGAKATDERRGAFHARQDQRSREIKGVIASKAGAQRGKRFVAREAAMQAAGGRTHNKDGSMNMNNPFARKADKGKAFYKGAHGPKKESGWAKWNAKKGRK